MREGLAPLVQQRERFEGTFIRYGYRRKRRTPADRTVLLRNVVHLSTGVLVAKHVWLAPTLAVELVEPVKGDRVRFTALVVGYWRRNASRDYGLRYPAEVALVHQTATKPAILAPISSPDRESRF